MWRNTLLIRSFLRLPVQVRCVMSNPGTVPSYPKAAKKVAEGQGCPLCRAGLQNFGYRDVLLLRQFLSPTGMIIGRRHTGVCRKSQRRLAESIRRSRKRGLLPNFKQPKQSEKVTQQSP